MPNERSVQINVTEIENIDAYIVDGLYKCLKPLIVYLEQNARTAAEAQALKNALDARRSFEQAQQRLTQHLPERRRD